ncbi:hypothetical protein POM88_047949 [Heracleum sosnowskyi]|uniref:Non-haem dioxygenase N-terminal domain-containing protein n=1 Tax=Heracleum sosnowskyi TaxID=360622 RepID=A0AAD8M045_9APIA|nr:hypothetical protein POM88_047949 [Heracleum sosnowskyi]
MDNEIDGDNDCVKEIVQRNSSFIPKRFILTENMVSKDEEITLLSAKTPVLDLALLSNGHEEEHKVLDEACKYWGFFLVINHGIPERILEDSDTLMLHGNASSQSYHGNACTYASELLSDTLPA